jgi:hypothetical protein
MLSVRMVRMLLLGMPPLPTADADANAAAAAAGSPAGV